MKNIFFILFSFLFLTQCQEEKPVLEQAAILKCECLATFDKEKGNLMEALNCSDEVSNMAEFSELDPILVSTEMEKICPNTFLPFDEIQQ